MGLFGKSKKDKKEECDCGGCCDMEIIEEDDEESSQDSPSSGNLTIKVFGPGCAKCKTLKENVMQALADTGKQADFEYVTDMGRIAEAGIMATPALEVGDRIVSSGKVLKPKDIAKYL